MASSHVKLILAVLLLGIGITTGNLSASTGEAAGDDEEIALEDYVDNELPNFSSDVSSTMFGDATGYDVHIEVKIANRSKDNDNEAKNENLHDVNEMLPSSTLGPLQNHDKAKKILDLIIDKLKRKKDTARPTEDDTDIEITEKDDFRGDNKAGRKKPDVDETSSLPKEEDAEDEFTKPKSDKTGKHGNTPNSEKLAFSLPGTAKTDAKAVDDFSFKAANSRLKQAQASPISEMTNFPQVNGNELTEKNGQTWESSKNNNNNNNNKKDESSGRRNRYVNIKVSDDGEIRIKVPEFLNKSSLVSKIVKVLNEDDKRAGDSEGISEAKQALVSMESKLGERNAYKVMLMKKKHFRSENPPEQSVLPDVSNEMNDTTLSIENKENEGDLPQIKASSLSGNDKQREHKTITSDREFSEMPRNDAFVPNRFASKSFQENLEPEKMFDANANSNPNEKKALDIVPLDLHIDDVNGQEKMNTLLQPKRSESRFSLLPRQHELDVANRNSPALDNQKYVQMQIVPMSIPKDNRHDVGDEQVPVLNPGRLFNDSLFQQAGLDNSEGLGGKRGTEKQISPTVLLNGKSMRDKSTAGKKGDLSGSKQPIIDVLTFPSASEMSATMIENKRKAIHPHVDPKQNKLHTTNAHNVDHRNENSHNVNAYGHKKPGNMADSNHGNRAKDGKRVAAQKEKVKPSNNPLPSEIFTQALNNDLALSRLTKKEKSKKKTGSEDEDVYEQGGEEKGISASAHAKDTSKGETSDLVELTSLQLQSKDNLEIGGDTQDDDVTGDDDEYEDASGDDEEEAVGAPNNADEASLNNANLAIWKASEDIHALLHSLTDRDHADQVLGNLKNFIRERHGGDTRKRNLPGGNKLNVKKDKKDFSYLNKKLVQKKRLRFPMDLELKRRSWIAEKKGSRHRRKRTSVARKERRQKLKRRRQENPLLLDKPYSKNDIAKRQNIIQYEKYTHHNGKGMDRLYNQLATSSSRITPTFEDDPEGWSPDEVKNVIKQLKTTDLEDTSPNVSNNDVVVPDDDNSNAPFYPENRRHVGLPQTSVPLYGDNVHAMHVMPLSEQFKKRTNMFPVRNYSFNSSAQSVNGKRDYVLRNHTHVTNATQSDV